MPPARSDRFQLRAFLLGWPALLVAWAYVIWLFYSLAGLLRLPINRAGSASSIDGAWLQTLLPSMYGPTIVVFAYLNWMGWKFFQHN
jgi:hypothetical protein